MKMRAFSHLIYGKIMFVLQFLFLGFCIHPGKQDIQHGNELVVALVRLAAEVDEGDVHQVTVFV